LFLADLLEPSLVGIKVDQVILWFVEAEGLQQYLVIQYNQVLLFSRNLPLQLLLFMLQRLPLLV
jgi:hypothetical protein